MYLSEMIDRLNCNICNRNFRSEEKKNEHEAAHDTLMHRCEDCGWMYTELYELEMHRECCTKRPLFSPSKAVMGLFTTGNYCRTVKL